MQTVNHSDEKVIELKERYGELIGGYDLAKLMGYRSTASFRQALARNQISIPIFSIENRKGKFAYTSDVAKWLKDLNHKETL